VLWAVAAAALAAAVAVAARAKRIKRRHLRFAGASGESDPGAQRLFESTRALYHGTRFRDGTALLIPAWAEPCVGDLFLTAEAIFLRREGQGALLQIALGAVDEAALHRAHAALAGKELPMLRLRWKRGGEELETNLSLRGGMASLETLRREIHLRQGNIAAQLEPFLSRHP
jgi:hypothetical protein